MAKVGSPPRVRGIVHLTEREIAAERITPACAGNRSPSGNPQTETLDHPRVCGE